MTHPMVGACIAAVVWFGTRSYTAPVIAAAAVIGFGALASHCAREQARGRCGAINSATIPVPGEQDEPVS